MIFRLSSETQQVFFPTSDNLLVDILSRLCIWVLLGSLPSQPMKHRTELRKPAAMIERISEAKRGDGEIYLRFEICLPQRAGNSCVIFSHMGCCDIMDG